MPLPRQCLHLNVCSGPGARAPRTTPSCSRRRRWKFTPQGRLWDGGLGQRSLRPGVWVGGLVHRGVGARGLRVWGQRGPRCTPKGGADSRPTRCGRGHRAPAPANGRRLTSCQCPHGGGERRLLWDTRSGGFLSQWGWVTVLGEGRQDHWGATGPDCRAWAQGGEGPSLDPGSWPGHTEPQGPAHRIARASSQPRWPCSLRAKWLFPSSKCLRKPSEKSCPRAPGKVRWACPQLPAGPALPAPRSSLSHGPGLLPQDPILLFTLPEARPKSGAPPPHLRRAPRR